MSQHDDFNSPDESEDTDSVIRELRAEIIRLEAQLDQLTASVRERAEETAIIAVQVAELRMQLVRLESRRRRDEKLLVLAWVLALASLAATLYNYLTL